MSISVSDKPISDTTWFCHSQEGGWLSAAILISGIALISLGCLTLAAHYYHLSLGSLSQVTPWTSFGTVLTGFCVASVAIILFMLRDQANNSVLDWEAGIQDVRSFKPLLSGRTESKLYYYPDTQILDTKRIRNKNRRHTLIRLENGSYMVQSPEPVGKGFSKTAYMVKGLSEGDQSQVRTSEKKPYQNDELAIYQALRGSPYTVQLAEVIQDTQGKRSLLLQWCEGGDFKNPKIELEEHDKLQIFHDALLGLHALHEQNFLHLDCHRGNVFIMKDKRGRLGDFGSSRVMRSLQTRLGFQKFMPVNNKLPLPIAYIFLAPEIVHNIGAYQRKDPLQPISGKADVWMLGMSMAKQMLPTSSAYQHVLSVQNQLMPTQTDSMNKFVPFHLPFKTQKEYRTLLENNYPPAPENRKTLEYLFWRMIHPNLEIRYSPKEAAKYITTISSRIHRASFNLIDNEAVA